MRYLAKNPVLLFFLFSFDLLFFWAKREKRIPKVKRILLTNLAHLGDVILSTAILPSLKESFPEATIDFVCGSWAQEVMQLHPYVDRVHLLDHWKLSRTRESVRKKWRRYCKMKRLCIRDLRSLRYDLAIDLYMFFPNSAHLLWKAHIPVRVGFSSGGSIFTREVIWQKSASYLPESYRHLLATLSLHPKRIHPFFPSSKKNAKKDPYLVFHIGSGSEKKKWKVEKWQKLLALCKTLSFPIFFTGKGEREEKEIEEIIGRTPYAKNLCNALTFAQWKEIIEQAHYLISVDSSATHLAAAVGTPSLILCNPSEEQALWIPPGSIEVNRSKISPEKIFMTLCTSVQK